MLEETEQQVGHLKELLKTPIPENFEAANKKLGRVMAALQSLASEPRCLEMRSHPDAAFLSRLPSDMAEILALYRAPVDYLEGLARFRAQKFGAYTCRGEMKGLGQESSARTITHL